MLRMKIDAEEGKSGGYDKPLIFFQTDCVPFFIHPVFFPVRSGFGAVRKNKIVKLFFGRRLRLPVGIKDLEENLFFRGSIGQISKEVLHSHPGILQ